HMFRNVILQALGAQPELQPVTGRVKVCRGDVLLLCSDGLSGKLRGEDMLRIVQESGGDLKRACEALIDEANERGGEDNITVVLARLTGDDLPPPDSERITVELPAQEPDDTIGHDDDTTERL
ncbi:MAG TPA: SpoIIE family protein phosphatase, partial [Pyrinomonadaceae bacterium]